MRQEEGNKLIFDQTPKTKHKDFISQSEWNLNYFNIVQFQFQIEARVKVEGPPKAELCIRNKQHKSA